MAGSVIEDVSFDTTDAKSELSTDCYSKLEKA